MAATGARLVSQACWVSDVSSRRSGSWSQSSATVVTAGVSKSWEAADVIAVPARFLATTSRSTPSSCTRSSSADWNRSAGSVAQHLATRQ